MRYWITTHWPHTLDVNKDEEHEDENIPDGREKSCSNMDKGDLVFFSRDVATKAKKYNIEVKEVEIE